MDEPAEFDVSAFRDRLVARRRELQELAESSADSRKPVELDQTRVGRLSRMDALQSQAMSLEAERRRKLELQRIEASLKRIEEGEYGYCVSCGEQIPLRRLELDPTLPTCVDCAETSGGGD
jgi:DnaK suppressor protein